MISNGQFHSIKGYHNDCDRFEETEITNDTITRKSFLKFIA